MKDTAALENSFTPDPRQFGLTEDFIYVEKAWGSLFYKHLGKLNKTGAKQICSQYGDSVHLPIPRFKDENDFYTNFIDGKLWLDISFDANDDTFKSYHDHVFIRLLHTMTDFTFVHSYDWIEITYSEFNEIIILPDGKWGISD